MSLRQWTLVMRIQSGWLFSTHHKKSFDFSCCCECFKIFNHGLICLVFVNFVRLFSDGLSELSVWVLYSSVILTVSGLKTFSRKSFRFAERIFFVKPNLKFFWLFPYGFSKWNTYPWDELGSVRVWYSKINAVVSISVSHSYI